MDIRRQNRGEWCLRPGTQAWTAHPKVRFAEDKERPRMEMTMAPGRSLLTQTNLSYAFVPDAN